MFEFLSYSIHRDGLYCLACVLFPDVSHRRPKKLISEPYQNGKDYIADMKSHSASEYHMNSMSKLKAFKSTSTDVKLRIDTQLVQESIDRVGQNRKVLKSIIKCFVLCGRQGIALRGHRYDDTCSNP